MKKYAFVMVFLLVFFSIIGLVFNSQATDGRLTGAYEYILSRYNPALGLVSESEDRGVNAVNGTTVNNTYWIYSDNLWAAEALKPYNATVAANISKTVRSYIKEYRKSMLFEVVLGEIIPTTIHAEKNIVAYNGTVNGSWVQILLDRHQFIDDPEGIFNDADKYADLCFYLTIDYWLMNDIHASEHWFSTGESLWNRSTNNGFYDKAARKEGLYQNMKLGLFLLAQRVTGFPSNITSAVEEAVWIYQRANGGIASLSHLNGTVCGTANVETTSALLLAYNDQLVTRLQRRQSPELGQMEELLADLNATYHSLLLNYTELLANYNFLQDHYNDLTASYNVLVGDYDALGSFCEGLNTTYNVLLSSHEAVLFGLSNMRDLMYAFIGATMFFIVTTVYFAKRKT